MQTFKVGDCWSVKNVSESYILVTRIDDVGNNRVVHVSYWDNQEREVLHLPISIEKFISSVKNKIGEKKVPKENLEAILVWQEDLGGVWDIEINEIIDITFSTINFEDMDLDSADLQ